MNLFDTIRLHAEKLALAAADAKQLDIDTAGATLIPFSGQRGVVQYPAIPWLSSHTTALVVSWEVRGQALWLFTTFFGGVVKVPLALLQARQGHLRAESGATTYFSYKQSYIQACEKEGLDPVEYALARGNVHGFSRPAKLPQPIAEAA